MDEREERRGRFLQAAVRVVAFAATVAVLACSREQVSRSGGAAAVLRVGVAGLSSSNPGNGLRQLAQILSVEGLTRLGEDGRPEPALAESWAAANSGRSYLVRLKSGVKFHDGTPLTPEIVASVLPASMRQTFGPIADDVERVAPVDANTVEITFRRPSPFLFEALEAGIRKPGSSAGTGPFVAVPNSTSELRANPGYYGGQPHIREIHVETFPAVRSAWAKMLRNDLDMLWEVGPDALSSLEHSANVAVFTFTRHYQYVVALNAEAAAVHSPTMRRALNMAVDRNKLVADALNGHAVPSWSPVSPRHWALEPSAQDNNPYDPAQAAQLLGPTTSKRASTRFTLLIASDAMYERIALELKRQLAEVGIEMAVEAVSQDQLFDRLQHGRYEAVLIDAISGPSLLRPYGFWHSRMPGNSGTFGNRAVDEAFDSVREAETESAYRAAIGHLVRAFREDPPAVFLAWSVRARAITTRFDVQAEEGRDVLSTLRFWRPAGSPQQASRN